MVPLLEKLLARRERLARELRKIEGLTPGSEYTLAFLGIHSGEGEAERTLTAQALPEYAGRFGLGPMDFGTRGNAALLPNGNWPHRAFLGMVNGAQVRLALTLFAAAHRRGLRLHLIAHSNGVNAAAEFLRRSGAAVASAVVIGPNTRSAATLRTIELRAAAFTLLTSDFDERLKMAWLGHRPAEYWRSVLPAARVVESQQRGHGAQCYLLSLPART
jgi:hypothetical protein